MIKKTIIKIYIIDLFKKNSIKNRIIKVKLYIKNRYN